MQMEDVGSTLRRELDLLTEDETAAALNAEPRTLADWRTNGAGPDYIKLGKSVFYCRSDLRRWIENNRVLRDLRAPPARGKRRGAA